MPTVYLGLGGNLGDPMENLGDALSQLRELPGIVVKAVSKLYRTLPVGGPPNQPDYLNAVVAIETSLPPKDLLLVCLRIEERLGRIRLQRWGPRLIDIDILLYGEAVIDEPGLIVPHPRLRERLFALLPLSDVAPDGLMIPPSNVALAAVIESALTDPSFIDQGPVTPIASNWASG